MCSAVDAVTGKAKNAVGDSAQPGAAGMVSFSMSRAEQSCAEHNCASKAAFAEYAGGGRDLPLLCTSGLGWAGQVKKRKACNG